MNGIRWWGGLAVVGAVALVGASFAQGCGHEGTTCTPGADGAVVGPGADGGTEGDAGTSGGDDGPSGDGGLVGDADGGDAGGSVADVGGGEDVSTEDYVPGEGDFLWPCLDNTECNSGWCIPTDEGSVCTKTCVDTCPLDWRCTGVSSTGADLVFLCTPPANRLCVPCKADHQCAGGYCVSMPNGKSCTQPCDANDQCDSGFECQEIESEETGETTKQCLPATGRCDCNVRNDGEERPCSNEVEGLGQCWGTQQCDGTFGWSACDAPTPTAEVCDGVDNDCDLIADEDITQPAEPCEIENGFGTCSGPWACAGEEGWQCLANEPAAEVCDFVDNDCDGEADEDFRDATTGLYVSYDNCGVCGNSCEGKVAFATQTGCEVVEGEARCVATACEGGYVLSEQGATACVPLGGGTDCSPCVAQAQCGELPGGQCEALSDGSFCTRGCTTDADCQGELTCQGGRCKPLSGACTCLSSNAGNTVTCFSANEHGTCFGTQTCDATQSPGWSACTAETPVAEVCDGLDNDCNGLPDDGLVHDPPTCEDANEFGTCSGTWICKGTGGWDCAVQTPSAEACDFQDNDCDGETDEDFVDATTGLYLSDEACGTCGVSCANALPNASVIACAANDGSPRCEVVECADGFFQKGPLACLPASGGANCVPCETDDNCAPGKCATLDDGTYCLNPCTDDGNCLEHYSCQDVDGAGTFCVPDTNGCTCDGTNTNLLRGCDVAYEPGDGSQGYTCLGTQQCTATGWTQCELPPEECNLLDDDCDGETDEDFLVGGVFATDDNCGACGNDCTLLTFSGGAGSCNTLVDPPICSLQCTGSCFDVNANPADGCECCDPQPVDLPDPEGYDANCDGIDGEKDNGIFVSKEGDDANTGLWGSPKLTIQAGIDAAVTLGKRDVYVAAGIYAETVSLALGKAVYGGYSADFRVRDSLPYESVVLSPKPAGGLVGSVNALDLVGGEVGATVFDGFSVYGYQVKESGGSSYAIYVRDADASLRLSHNKVFAGSGGKGLRGADGQDGPDGAVGAAGADALDLEIAYGVDRFGCTTAHYSVGGQGGAQTCGGVSTDGGSGGNRVCPEYDACTLWDADGSLCATGTCTAACPNPSSTSADVTRPPVASEWGTPGANAGGAGGAPGRDVWHQAFSCDGYNNFGSLEGDEGANGGDGAGGSSGAGCADVTGAVVNGLWSPGVATPGTTGQPGAGGGGGGSGAGAAVHDSCDAKGFAKDNMGGTGGGGGAGGCQGTLGGAGTSGGGAFGIFIVFTAPPTTVPSLSDNLIAGGAGGDGGDGGPGGVGGAGGDGGLGGAPGGSYLEDPVSPTYPAFQGGKGGKGGNGGAGGGGGGGCGGPAVGIFAAGQGGADLSAWASGNTFAAPGLGGAGGFGGFSLGNSGGDGASGAVMNTNF